MTQPTDPDALFAPRAPGEAAGPAPLVLGCMNFGKRTPEAEASRIVGRALDAGVTLFDTANAYGDGESERVLGRLLARSSAARGPEGRARVATKVGWWRKEGLRPERVRASLDESLARLGLEQVDLYYLHVPDPETPPEATLEGVRDVLASGKALRWGVSNFASWQILELVALCDRAGLARPAASQQLYNLLIRQLDVEYFRFARKYRLHTTVYNPLAGGLLAGRHAADGSTTKGSRFDKNPLYQRRYLSEAFFGAVEALREVAAAEGLTLATLAYAWLARRPGVDSILVGPGTLDHLEAALAAARVELRPEVLGRLDELHRALVGTDASYAR